MNRLKLICEREMNIIPHKLSYALRTGLLKGLVVGLVENYNIQFTKEVFDIFYLVLSSKLSESTDIEHEWTELEWESLMEIKKMIN